jgi:PAS domain S-box-containing protein
MGLVLVLGAEAERLTSALTSAGLTVHRCEVPNDAMSAAVDEPCVLLWDTSEAPLAVATAEVLRQRPRGLVVSIALASDRESADRARAQGAEHTLPPWPDEVVATVRRALQRTATSSGLEATHRDTFFAMSLDMLCIANIEGYFRQLNPAWSTLGWSIDELTSRPFIDFVHPDDVVATLEVMSRLTTSDFSTISFENRYRCRDGSYRWLLWSARTSHDAMRPEDRLYFAVARDITERKDREAEQKRQTERLERSNAELEQFAHLASHDLQEPLRMVSSYVRLLERRYKGRLDPEADKYIQFALDGTERMRSLIADLLTFARLGYDDAPAPLTDLADVWVAVLDDLRAVIVESGAEVTSGPWPTLLAHPSHVHQILANLVGNALKFRRPEVAPRVRVATALEDGAWHFTVADNGIGIEPENFQRIFELFQRLHGQAAYPGTGLGLAIVKKLVMRHGGKVWVTSKPGEGTTIHFTLAA